MAIEVVFEFVDVAPAFGVATGKELGGRVTAKTTNVPRVTDGDTHGNTGDAHQRIAGVMQEPAAGGINETPLHEKRKLLATSFGEGFRQA